MRALGALVLGAWPALAPVARPQDAPGQVAPPASTAALSPPPAPVASPSGPTLSFTIPRAASAIRVDGILDDEAWKGALVLDLAYEIDPGENTPAPVKTECLLLYDASGLHAAFRAHDPDPAAIRAHLSDRDQAFRDDFVGIFLDTFNDERRGVQLFVNPLGVQMDGSRNDVGNGGDQSEDPTWDAIWHSAGRITGDGYEVEMSVPFTSLRFSRAGRLVPLIPAPRAHQVRYHGVLAPCAGWRDRVVPAGPPPGKAARPARCRDAPDEEAGHGADAGHGVHPSVRDAVVPSTAPGSGRSLRRYTWADLLRRVFDHHFDCRSHRRDDPSGSHHPPLSSAVRARDRLRRAPSPVG